MAVEDSDKQKTEIVQKILDLWFGRHMTLHRTDRIQILSGTFGCEEKIAITEAFLFPEKTLYYVMISWGKAEKCQLLTFEYEGDTGKLRTPVKGISAWVLRSHSKKQMKSLNWLYSFIVANHRRWELKTYTCQ